MGQLEIQRDNKDRLFRIMIASLCIYIFALLIYNNAVYRTSQLIHDNILSQSASVSLYNVFRFLIILSAILFIIATLLFSYFQNQLIYAYQLNLWFNHIFMALVFINFGAVQLIHAIIIKGIDIDELISAVYFESYMREVIGFIIIISGLVLLASVEKYFPGIALIAFSWFVSGPLSQIFEYTGISKVDIFVFLLITFAIIYYLFNFNKKFPNGRTKRTSDKLNLTNDEAIQLQNSLIFILVINFLTYGSQLFGQIILFIQLLFTGSFIIIYILWLSRIYYKTSKE